MKPARVLSYILWFCAVHSFFAGLGLIFMPASAMSFFGFTAYVEGFFPAQGGIFHIVMSIAYAMAATDLRRFRELILFAIIAKFTATAFLLVYFLAIDSIWIVFVSGIGDGLMGLAILLAYRANRRRGSDL